MSADHVPLSAAPCQGTALAGWRLPMSRHECVAANGVSRDPSSDCSMRKLLYGPCVPTRVNVLHLPMPKLRAQRHCLRLHQPFHVRRWPSRLAARTASAGSPDSPFTRMTPTPAFVSAVPCGRRAVLPRNLVCPIGVRNAGVARFASSFVGVQLPLCSSRSQEGLGHSPGFDEELVVSKDAVRLTTSAVAFALTPNILIFVGGAVAFLLSAALGSNDVANSLGTAVGTGAIKVHQALVIGAVMEFAGAVLFGSTVTRTISSGVVSVGAATLAAPVSYMLGMCCVLAGCTVWMAAATKFGLPVSSTHSVVGALVGLGLVSGWGINLMALKRIVMSWFLSPMIGALIASLVYKVICTTIVNSDRPARATRRVLPFIAGGSAFVLTLFVIGKGARFAALTPDRVVYIALSIALAAGGLARALSLSIHSREYITRKFSTGGEVAANPGGQLSVRSTEGSVEEQKADVERIFKVLQVVTACLLAFSHGSNDVSNAIGPFAAMYSMWQTATVGATVAIPPWVLVLGGLGISSGLALFGRPVMETVGKKITKLQPTMGFSVELSTAITVLVASELGLPVSTTHTLIGCIVAIGLASGDKNAVDGSVLAGIAGSWGVTLPLSALFTVAFYVLTRPLLPVATGLL